MKKWGLVLLLLIYFPFIYKTHAQNITNEGTDFWAVFPTHDPSGNEGNLSLANIRIYVTSKTNSEVTVSCGTSAPQTLSIPANTAVPFDVQRTDAYIEEADGNTILSQKGIHIEVTPGMGKVAVYAHIYAGARSAASLILPKEALGQKYYSMNYTQSGNSGVGTNKNFLTLVATEPNTTLLIHRKFDSPIQVSFINAGEVYEYMPSDFEDLTGTFVEVDPSSADNCTKRFAAFSGSTSLSISCNGSRDPLFQQLYPTTSWGKSYGIVPFKDRRYLIRILAEKSDTRVEFNGETISLNEGQYYESSNALTEPSFVTADKRISVAQYSLTQDCSGADGGSIIGDPEMVMLNPIEFNIKAVTLFSSNKENIVDKYINVCIKTSAAPSFKINDQPVADGWQIIPSNPEYSCIQLPVYDESSYLTASDGFNAIAYGFGDHESYAYSAGTNLAANNYLLINNKITNIDAPNACIGQNSNFKIVLDYEATQIKWKLDNEPEVIFTPIPVYNNNPDDPKYTYTYNKDFIFSILESRGMLITVTKPNDDNCLGGEIEYNFTFDVNPIPSVAFTTANTNVCADTEILFTDNSLSNLTNRPVNKWLWNFGDGTPVSTDQNPKHIFSASGTYTVSLSAGMDDGCMADAVPVTIIVKPKIITKFIADALGCINREVLFTDQSMAEMGTAIARWYWDFGDNTPPPADATIQDARHTYSKLGKYTVTLTTETADGCRSLLFSKEITITGLPKPDFILPEVCVADGIVEFKNASVDVSGNNSNLTYTWDFGDAGSALNASPEINGTHKYISAGYYRVTLTATNINGCSESVTKDFTVNGSDVRPSFIVINENNLCSDIKVKFKNTSQVKPLGSVTKLRLYFDADNKPNEFIEDNDPVFDKEYELLYPAATSPVPRIINVKMIAFSGQTCAVEISHLITLHPSPHVVFNTIPDICVNANKLQLNQGIETLNVPGNGMYSGKGITPDGIFDPKEAGVGIHDITYTFTAVSGCIDSKTQTITVTPIPTLNISTNIYILIGGEKKVEASASGTGMTYKWTPSIGLDKDDILNPTITGEVDRTYTLTVTSSQACSISELVYLHVLPSIQPENAFSPNADGINDVWNLKYIETYPNTTVEIFNRYGTRVFFSNGYAIPFDGNYKNQPLPVGTYYYIINPQNGRKRITGSLTLLR